MIATINGQVADIDKDSVIVEVAGVGLRVFVPLPLLAELQRGKAIGLHTYLAVRENDLSLYGFKSKEERQYFEHLLGVSGIGPRLALAALSTLEPNAIRRAVFNEQAEIFSQVPGIGKKTAQQILLHLKDKLPDAEGLEPLEAMAGADSEVLEALTSLGYSVVEAQAALQSLPKDAPEDVEERLKLALAYFSK
jgi:Holliday junction DNA helicase RuvA